MSIAEALANAVKAVSEQVALPFDVATDQPEDAVDREPAAPPPPNM